jgi:uncharacterized protein (DUF1684 family)
MTSINPGRNQCPGKVLERKVVLSSEDRQKEFHVDALLHFRKQKDYFFTHNPQSPLTGEQKTIFRRLGYFPEAAELRFEVPVEEYPLKEEILMQTSTGNLQPYLRFGKVHLEIEGQEVELTIYANRHGFFLPFVDGLGGVETYAAGRYLEPVLLPNEKLLIDFNLAYNPFCAYNDRWSCPLPPAENRLRVPIRAGEKKFHP